MVAAIIFLFTAAVMIGIGIAQIKSEKPVGFYSGEQPPDAEELTDVRAWNIAHGRMWVCYGVLILVSGAAGVCIGDSLWCLIPFSVGTLVPPAFMARHHHRLMKQYKR